MTFILVADHPKHKREVYATAIIISQAARAEGRRRGGYCATLLDRCDYGEDWACRRFHYRCE